MMRRHVAAALACVLVLAGCASRPPTVRVSTAETMDAAGLVDVRTRVPDLSIDMRYAGSNNFTGRPVPGYDAPRCLLLAPAADALARVEAELRAAGYRLHVFDCYRPVRAVRAFVAWVRDPADDAIAKAAYYPNLDKAALLGDYIAETSGHSRGATIDLTLQQCAGDTCKPLDMGTAFDLFDPRAHTDTPAIDAARRAHRQRLRAAMARHGFENYALEWWHYTLRPEPTPDRAYDVPIR